MTDTSLYTELGVFPNGSGTFDVTNATEVTATRTPTGCVVMCVNATALDTPTNDVVLSWGITDFTTIGQISCTDEDNVSPVTDVSIRHNEVNIIQMLDPGTTGVDRSATVAAITGGVRFTASTGTRLYRVQVILIFGTVCKAFSIDGNGGWLTDETENVAHGMTTEPGAGFYGFNRRDNGGAGSFRWSLGFHAYDGVIKQCNTTWTSENGADPSQNTSRTYGDGTFDRVVCGQSAIGGAQDSLELTAIDTTNVTYTNRDATHSNKIIGLLLECEDVKTDIAIINSPTNPAVDWTYAGIGFQPQFVSLCVNRNTVVDVSKTDGDAGAGAFVSMDEEGRQHSMAWSMVDNLDLTSVTTNTSCELAQELFCPNETGANSHLMKNPTFNSTGWVFGAADITSANGTVRKWPMLAIEQLSGASNAPLFSVI